MAFLHDFHRVVQWLAGLGGPLAGCALLALLGLLAAVLFLPVRPTPRHPEYREYWKHS